MLARAKRIVATSLLVAATVFPAFAWPDRPVHLIVGFQAGGSSDAIARLLGEQLRPALGGTAIIVENKPGAAGSIAADAVLGARDGHSLLMFSDTFVTASLVNRSVRFRPLRDFKMVSVVCEGPLVLLAGPAASFRDFKEFVSYAKANPGKVNYASSGIGGLQHLTGVYISTALGLELTHLPTRGGGQAASDLVGGQIEAAVLGLGPTLAYIRAGKIRALAVSTASRVRQLPDVPTLMELGVPEFAVAQWFGLVGPNNMPDAVVDQLSRAVGAALADETIRRRFEEVGFIAQASTPDEFTDKVRAEEARWKRLVDEHGLKVD
ncbi:MAG: tripartite tricarboxylate transporter substrate binding protein [Alphaproteobacteria bacterium]|nr:tripartite tricarboxylate transporter substrate binding protein [Alphaproteobacteria bacterium]